jgi:hypothetical protein
VCAAPAAAAPRSEHDTLTDDDIAVYNTPEGMLSSDVVPEGVYVPEVVVNKNVRKARGRMRVSAQHMHKDGEAVEAADHCLVVWLGGLCRDCSCCSDLLNERFAQRLNVA